MVINKYRAIFSQALSGAMVNLYALTAGGLSFALGATGLGAAGVGALRAFSIMGGMAAGSMPVYSVSRTLDGAFVVKAINMVTSSNGNITLKIDPSADAGTYSDKSSPKITAMTVNGNKITLKLTNVYAKDSQGQILPTKLKFWISAESLNIDDQGNATSDLWNGNALQSTGFVVWAQLGESAANGDTYTLTLPKNIALSLHVITVQRMVGIQDLEHGTETWNTSGDDAAVAIQGQSDISVVSTGIQINVSKNGELIKEIKYADFVGKVPGLPYFIGGYKTDQLVFSEDKRLLFVAGSNGRIAIVDTATLSIVDYWQVPGSTDNITSLAVCGDNLYVAEGGRFVAGDGAHRLMRVNINELSKDFLSAQQINLPPEVSNMNTPYGYFDLSVVQGTHDFLAVTASQSNIPLVGNIQGQGQVFILDLDALATNAGTLSAPVNAIRIVSFAGTGNGKSPQYITAAPIKYSKDKNNGVPLEAHFLLSNAGDYNNGVDAISITLNPDGSFKGEASVTPIALSLSAQGISNALADKYQLNIQRAQGAVYYYDPVSKSEYALVADYHMNFNDPGYADGATLGKQIGGKIGIIKDPFGTHEYLGSTTPIINASIKELSISPESNSLLGNINYWEGGSNGVLSWNLSELIKAANAHSIKQQNSSRPIPFDRTGNASQNTQIPGATPVKLDYGYVIGMAGAATAPVAPAAPPAPAPDVPLPVVPVTVLPAGTVVGHFGDILRIDLVAAIKALPSGLYNDASNFTGFNVSNLKITSGNAVKVTYGADHLVSGARSSTLPYVSAATDASYSGVFNSGGELNSGGVFFLSASFSKADMKTLRAGGRLGNRPVTISIAGLTIDGVSVREPVIITVTISDFTDTAGRVFFGDRPLNDPGYTAFKLSGAVGAATVSDTAAKALDVFRVEQRLRYLGYSTFGMPDGAHASVGGGKTLGKPKELKFDGIFGAEEESALRAFYGATHYKQYWKVLATNSTSGANGFQTTINNVGAKTVLPGSVADTNLGWLNAYNAPHWMNIYTSFGIPFAGSTANFIDGTTAKEENYATSWTRDLLEAWVLSKGAQGLTGGKLQINGLTDPTYDFATHNRGGHSVGMGIDLGVGQYIISDNQTSTIHNGSALSIAGNGYNQRDALKNFLSIYALTQTDGTNKNGTLTGLADSVKNGETASTPGQTH